MQLSARRRPGQPILMEAGVVEIVQGIADHSKGAMDNNRHYNHGVMCNIISIPDPLNNG
jgi:hypothetical protein